ncbi:proton channel OTOP2-like [Discoglossus pictus]
MTMENTHDLGTSNNYPEHKTTLNGTNRPPDNWKKGSRLLSGLIGSNVLLFGCTLMTCVFTKELEFWDRDLLIFLSIMMLICIIWMVFQMFFSYRYKDAVLYKDCQAGPIWMRGFIVLFGIGTIVMITFRIVNSVSLFHCENIMRLIQPIIHAIFIIVQTYFLWVSSKHCVQIYTNATRCGLMILLMMNLIIWVIAVTEEARHHMTEMERFLDLNNTKNTSREPEEQIEVFTSCQCNSVCRILPTAFVYLYPFYIEFNLLAAAMIYIIWKNVGRQIDDNASHHHGLGPGVREHIPLCGLISGVSILIIGLLMFILYEMGRENILGHFLSLTTFYYFHVISLFLMSLASLMGSIIFRLDKRSMDNEKNPSRTLDMTLLLGTTLAQYAISYYSIIAMISSTPLQLPHSLTLTYSLLMIIQHSLQNVFIIEGLHRLPPNNQLVSHGSSDCLTLQSPQEGKKHVAISEMQVSCVHDHEDPPQTRRMSRRATLTLNIRTHLKKRKTLKDIYLFLFLCNIIFWIMPAFGARIRFDNGLEVQFYGFYLWSVITNVCLPFGIFYRMHSAAGLLELYSMS